MQIAIGFASDLYDKFDEYYRQELVLVKGDPFRLPDRGHVAVAPEWLI
jgi:hypothetical protein